MEFIFEFLAELILEGTFELSRSKRVPKVIRFFLIFVIVLVFASVIALILYLGLILLKSSMIAGILIIILGLLMLILSIIKFKQVYLDKTNKE